jgi:hypothetical protein
VVCVEFAPPQAPISAPAASTASTASTASKGYGLRVTGRPGGLRTAQHGI